MQTQLSPVTTSKQFSLKLNDFWKGLLMAVGTPVIAIMLAALQAGSFNFDWKAIGTVAAASLLMYLSKNFFSPSQIVVKDPAAVKAVESGNAEITMTH
jgi:hypothetical protein